jgi:DNA-binding PadR family transcriptional regulator
MSSIDFYNLMMDTDSARFGAIAAVRAKSAGAETTSPNPLLQLRRGLAESPAWFLIQAAEFEPEPLSVARLRVRDIYAAEGLVHALLELMASEKWFDRARVKGEEFYHLTENGRSALARLRDGGRQVTASLEPLPLADLAHLENLLRRIIQSSLNSPTPPGTWCLSHSNQRAPDEAAPALVKIAHHFADFNAYRDDAHMAAWQPHDIEGYVWEAFSFIWGGAAASAEALFDQLAYLGYSRADYATALRDLTRRNWLEEIPGLSGAYRLTDSGRAVREEAERLTDHYFYAPWSVLAEDETGAIHALLVRLHDNLQQMAQ